MDGDGDGDVPPDDILLEERDGERGMDGRRREDSSSSISSSISISISSEEFGGERQLTGGGLGSANSNKKSQKDKNQIQFSS